MKIIDKKTGKRLTKSDPIKRKAIKDIDSDGCSPMDPPDAYDDSKNVAVETEEIPAAVQTLLDEHKEILTIANAFEEALKTYVEGQYQMNDEINQAFSDFFSHLDKELVKHNAKEEKALFPILNKKLKETGEHSDEEVPRTAIHLMEDDHNQFVQLGTLSFNMFGLAPRLNDDKSRLFVLETATRSARELVELIKLHIYREENKLFPLAQQLISTEEFEEINAEMGQIP